MTRIHEDRFKFGDIVTWRDEHYATCTEGRKRLGDCLTIKETRDVSRYFRSVGHTQHVTILEDPNAGFDGQHSSCFSGAYFRHLAPWEKTQ